MNQTKMPELAGAVLIGGKSQRMGFPKATIEIDGEKLALRTARLLKCFTEEVYISGRTSQQELVRDVPFPFIADKYRDIGPVAGILSVFEYLLEDRCMALLATATDLPFLDEKTLDGLISRRNPEKSVTLFQHKQSGFLEPLCAIYEPVAYKIILKSIKNKQYAPHRIFPQEQLERVNYDGGRSLTNLNRPGQWKDLRNRS